MREPWIKRVGIELFVIIVAIGFVLPVVFIYLQSLKPDREIVRFESVLPKDLHRGFDENYAYVLNTPEG